MNVKNVLISSIDIGSNTRSNIDKKELTELKESIEASGLLQPIGVKSKKDKYELIWGFRRLECFKLLNKKEIPAMVVVTDDGIGLHIIENLQRKDIAPLDLAAAIKKYRDKSKLTLNEIAKIIGKSIHEVTQINKLNELHLPLSKLLEKGQLDLDAAYYICRFPEAEQKEFYNDIRGDNRIDMDDTERFFRNRKIKVKNFAWKLDKTFPKLPTCIKCTDRSSFHGVLFPEFKDDDTCLNLKCFENKIKINLQDIIKETNPEDLIFVENDNYPTHKHAPEKAKVYSKNSLKKVAKRSADSVIGVTVNADSLSEIGKIGFYQKLPKSNSESMTSGKTKIEDLSPAEQKKRKIELYKRKCDLIMFPLAGEIGKEITDAIKATKFSDFYSIPVAALNIIASYTYQKAHFETQDELEKIWNQQTDKRNVGKIFQMLITAATYQSFDNLNVEYFADSDTYERLRETASVLGLGLNEIENKLKPQYDEKINQLTERFIKNNKFDPKTGI